MTSALHLAAMPFPSVQGTQAAVRAMIDAEHQAGRAPALLTYAHAGYEIDVAWPIHRIPDVTRDRSLRSGPSVRKVMQDGLLALGARRVHRELRPSFVIAHHVEATAAALAARLSPVVFVVHTALGPELPTYFSARASRVAARVGDVLDFGLAKRADRVAAISPRLVEHFAERGVDASYLPIPWSVPPAIDPAERVASRARLGIEAHEPLLLYAGNLDAYQGLPDLVRAFTILSSRRRDARLLLASASDSTAIERTFRDAGLHARVHRASIADEADRRRVHAAADLVIVPRAAPGGLPIKLLDALSRGVPAVVTRRACAGLSLSDAATVTRDDDPEALAAAAFLLLEARESARELGQRGSAYIAREHTAARYLAALDEITRF